MQRRRCVHASDGTRSPLRGAGDAGRVAHLAYNDCAWFMEYVDPDLSASATGLGITLDASNNATFAYQRRAAGTGTPASSFSYSLG